MGTYIFIKQEIIDMHTEWAILIYKTSYTVKVMDIKSYVVFGL